MVDIGWHDLSEYRIINPSLILEAYEMIMILMSCCSRVASGKLAGIQRYCQFFRALVQIPQLRYLFRHKCRRSLAARSTSARQQTRQPKLTVPSFLPMECDGDQSASRERAGWRDTERITPSPERSVWSVWSVIFQCVHEEGTIPKTELS
jgi:hypothetical protein